MAEIVSELPARMLLGLVAARVMELPSATVLLHVAPAEKVLLIAIVLELALALATLEPINVEVELPAAVETV